MKGVPNEGQRSPHIPEDKSEENSPHSPKTILTSRNKAQNEHNTRRGELRRPWIQYRDSRAPVRVFLMTKRNFKVYADIGDSPTRLLRTLSVLDTGAGPNFIRKNALPAGDLTPLSYGPLPDIADANSNHIQVKGITRLLVRLKTRHTG